MKSPTKKREKNSKSLHFDTKLEARIRKKVVEWGNPHYPAPGKDDDVTSDELVDRIFADTLGFLFVLCFSPDGCSVKVAQRRFLALVYIYRPDLIDGRSVQWMADEIGVTKGQIGQHLMALREEIGATGINSMTAEGRRRVREGQMRARLRNVRSRPRKRTRPGRS